MRTGTIKSHWLALDPHHRLDAEFWLRVIDHLRAAGVDPETARDDAVRAAIEEEGGR